MVKRPTERGELKDEGRVYVTQPRDFGSVGFWEGMDSLQRLGNSTFSSICPHSALILDGDSVLVASAVVGHR